MKLFHCLIGTQVEELINSNKLIDKKISNLKILTIRKCIYTYTPCLCGLVLFSLYILESEFNSPIVAKISLTI